MLTDLMAKKKKGFIPFLVVGDPNLEVSERAVDILIEEGADIIELGVPFSDAMADGPVIQAASERASAKTSMTDVLAFAKKSLSKHPGFPFLLFTYYNPILKMGVEKFAAQAQSAGIYGVLVVDLPPEESMHYSKILANHGVKAVFLASPTTTPERLAAIAKASTGFIYYVSRTGVTGVQTQVSKSLAKELEAIRKLTSQPIAVGFGISNGEQAREVALVADASVVGSAFVKLIANSKNDSALNEVRKLAKEIRKAVF